MAKAKKWISTSKMKPETKEVWVKALRSGEYEQTTSVLQDNTGNCCLGVLCKVVKGKYFKENQDCTFGCDHADNTLTPIMLEKVGLSFDDQQRLISMNDTGSDEEHGLFEYKKRQSFKQIATWIEKNIPVKETKKRKAAQC